MPARAATKRGRKPRKKLTGRVAGARPRGVARRNAFQSIDRQIGVPDKHRIRMRYNEYVAITPMGGFLGFNEFRCDSLYDPNLTGVGHKPMGSSQILSAYYIYGLVVGAKITVQFIPHTASTAIPIACGIFTYDKSQTSLPVQGYLTWPTFRESGETVKFIATDKPSVTASANYSMHKLAGVDPRGSSNYWNTQSAGPIIGTTWVFYVWCQSQDMATAPGTIGCNVQIDYIVDFFDRVPLAPS